MLNYVTFDTCGLLIYKLRCEDKSLDDTFDPLWMCQLTQTDLAETTRTIEAVTVQGAQTDQFCAEREAKTVRDGCTLTITDCAYETPELQEIFGTVRIVRDELGNITGVKAPSDISDCTICKKNTEDCKPLCAIQEFRPMYCGKPIKRHPEFDFEVTTYPCVEFQPTDNTETRGAGFRNNRTYTATLDYNPNFIDPYGIMDTTNSDIQDAKWCKDYFVCPDGSEIEDYLDQTCGCGACQEVEAA